MEFLKIELVDASIEDYSEKKRGNSFYRFRFE